MDTPKSTNDEIFEILLRKALILKYENEAAEAQREANEYSFSDKFKKKLKKTYNSINRAERIKLTVNIIKKAAVITASVMGILFSVLMTQPEVYAAVEKVFKTVFSTHDSYIYQGAASETQFNMNIRLGYVPDGYDLRSAFFSDNNVSLTYESLDEKYIYFDYGLAENSLLSVDNERHKCHELKDGNTTFYFYQAINDGDNNTLIWYDGNYYYCIDAQYDDDILVKMAKNIKM